MSLLLLGKAQDPYFDRAVRWLEGRGESVTACRGKRTDPYPEVAQKWTGEWLISYLSPWIVPAESLKRATEMAINFHPGPPEYPGIGCTNFAVYNGEKEFGVTGHVMLPKVDTGKILGVRRFEILAHDTVYDLTQRCYEHIWLLFEEVMGNLLDGKPVADYKGGWKRKPYLRSELDALCELAPGMSAEEMRRRIRATTFPGMPGAFLKIDDIRYDLIPQSKAQKKS